MNRRDNANAWLRSRFMLGLAGFVSILIAWSDVGAGGARGPDLQEEQTAPPSPETAELKEKLDGVIRQAAEDFPESVEPQIIRGMMYREVGDYVQAVKTWQEVLVEAPRLLLSHLGPLHGMWVEVGLLLEVFLGVTGGVA